MRPLSPGTKAVISSDPYYRVCARKALFGDHDCQGRITMDHAIIFAGRQLDAPWAIVPTCAWAHDVDQFQDGHNYERGKQELCALMRATETELRSVSKAINYLKRMTWLKQIYGVE